MARAYEIFGVDGRRNRLCCFVRDDAETVTSFAGKLVHQAPGLFVRQVSRLTTALAEDCPRFSLQITNHRLTQSSLSQAERELLTFKISFTFLQKRFHAFVFVFAREAKREQVDFATESLVKIRS